MLVFRKGKPDVRMLFVYGLFAVLFIGVSVFNVFYFQARMDEIVESVVETEQTATTQFVEDVPEIPVTSTPTPTIPEEEPVEDPVEEPVVEDLVFTFDLTDDTLVFETENRLSYYSSYEEIVILGGPGGLYRLDAGEVSENGEIYWYSYLQTYRFSLNRDKIAFLSDYAEGDLWDLSYTGRGTLRYYDGTAAVKISKDVCDFELSDDGTGVAYLMYSETPDAGSELYVYNTDTKKSVLISSFASDGFVLSPDGDTIAYREYTEPGNNAELYCYYQEIGEESVTVSAGVTPVALTNRGDTIYYCTSTRFFVTSGEITRTLCSDSDFLDGIIFNIDHSQVLFPDNSGLSFSANGGKPVSFSAGTPIIMDREGNYSNAKYSGEYYRYASLNGERLLIYTINKKNLCNLLIQGESILYYFDENLMEQTLEQERGWYGHYVGDGQGVLCQEMDPETGQITYCFLSDFMDPDCVPLGIGDQYVTNLNIAAPDAIFYNNDVGQLFRVAPDGSETMVDTYASLVGFAEYEGITYLYYHRVQIYGRGVSSGDLYCKEYSADNEMDPILIEESNWVGVHETDPRIVISNNWKSLDKDDEWSDYLYDLNWSTDGIHFSPFMTMRSVNFV